MSRALDEALSVVSEDDLTIADTSVGLPLSSILVTPPIKKVDIFFEDAQVRVKVDSTAPTSSVGELFNPYDRQTLFGPEQAYKWRAIRTGSTSATAHYRILR